MQSMSSRQGDRARSAGACQPGRLHREQGPLAWGRFLKKSAAKTLAVDQINRSYRSGWVTPFALQKIDLAVDFFSRFFRLPNARRSTPKKAKKCLMTNDHIGGCRSNPPM